MAGCVPRKQTVGQAGSIYNKTLRQCLHVDASVPLEYAVVPPGANETCVPSQGHPSRMTYEDTQTCHHMLNALDIVEE